MSRSKNANGYSPLILFSALSLLAGTLLMSCAVKEPAAVEGTWVITDSVTPGISALLPAESKNWLGQSFHYDEESVELGQTRCGKSTWTETSFNEKDFISEYHISFQDLDIVANKISRFDVECAENQATLGKSILVADNNHAFTYWDGVFFKMEKAEPAAAM